MGKNRTKTKVKLTNNGVVAGRIEPVKKATMADLPIKSKLKSSLDTFPR